MYELTGLIWYLEHERTADRRAADERMGRLAAGAADGARRARAWLKRWRPRFEPDPARAERHIRSLVERRAEELRRSEVEVEVYELTVTTFGEGGFTNSVNRVLTPGPDGRPQQQWVKESLFFQREGGRWRVVHRQATTLGR
ncbi:Cif family virulence factor [Rhizomonospora bruguierae]|uniref:hypothetical protein n=1 Tax=Rhizomonospora bruguierae TaxID=1581705 RepID=UPI001BCE9E95|nr:hypothetical protein [Micromonospora sp. NBRC 107566]